MATETLYAASHIAGAFSNPANAVGSGTGTWAGDLNVNSNYTSRWAMATPTEPLTSGATQTVAVVARKGSNSGTPTIAINLYENGSLVQSVVGTTSVTSTVGQTIQGTFPSSAITNRAAVEIEIVQISAGGSPSARNSAQIDYIQWTADVTPIVPQSFVANVLATTSTVYSPTTLLEQRLGAVLLGTGAVAYGPTMLVGVRTVVGQLLPAPPTLHAPTGRPGGVAATAMGLSSAPVVHAPGTRHVVAVPVLAAAASVRTPTDVMLAVNASVTVPHIYV